ncbi:MAG: hypothetical protein J0I84_18115 [Terrimonas sp.]|nr:hypothetical protein [Terrimonas sp.]
MNRKLPYEELIAGKMQELHLPERDEAWQKMQNMLNKEMPQEPAGKKRFAGRWKRIGWLTLLLIGIIGSGVYFSGADKPNNNATAEINSFTTDNQESISPSNEIILPVEKENKIVSSPDKNIASLQKEETSFTAPPSIPKHNNNLTDNQPSHTLNEEHALFNNVPPAKNDKTKSNTAADIPGEVVTNNREDSQAIANNSKDEASKKEDIAASIVQHNQSQINAISREEVNTANNDFTVSNNENNSIASPQSITASLAKLENDALPAPASDITLTVPGNVWQLPDVTAKKKTILKEMKRLERKQERALAKSYKSHWSFWGNETERWFAAGIAPYQNFAIAAQQSYNYNSGAGKNMIADYIPSPYLQLHVTDRIYLLSEFQFNAPQATPNLLLAQNNTTIPMNNVGYTENIYLKKLYYFNMPLSFYYSPVKNFYLGSGLQFSSFNSGLAYREQLSNNNTILNAQTFKIKDDSLSSKINASEWRYLFDANYYVDRFMFGFRYNQALNNFVNLKVNNILPPTQARNEAFQFYIRYNLVVSKRN